MLEDSEEKNQSATDPSTKIGRGHADKPASAALAAPRAATLVSSPTDEHVFLVGRPPIGEYLAYVRSLSAEEFKDFGPLMDEWRHANDHIRELEATEKGWADNPAVNPLPESMSNLKEKATKDPIFRRSFSMVPSDISMVELDRLVVWQKHINLNYVRELTGQLGKSPTEEEIFLFSLPVIRRDPTARFMQTGQNTFTFVSPSDDLRFLEATLLRPGQVQEYSATGPLSGVVGLMVGYGSNYLNAIRVDGRLILNNGSHRAHALRQLGITHVPCVVQNVTRREELEVVASGDFGQNPDRYLGSPRPPVLKDYFDPQLTKRLQVHRKLRQVTVSFGVQAMDVPAT